MGILTIDYTAQDAPELFCQSLQTTGFGVLTHHPIAPELIRTVYTEWEGFFQSQQKMQYTYRAPSQQGYFPFKTENAKNHTVSDLKEFYHVYRQGLIPPTLAHHCLALFDGLSHLAARLLKWIEHGLPIQLSQQLSIPLYQMIHDCENTVLRIIHYPPLTPDRDVLAVRAAPHEDINLLTLLPAATTPGLEVLDKQQHWHAVNCDPGNIVVNVGDMLQACTEHYYQSTTHRVINPDAENVSRYSMPFFLHARPEVRISAQYTAGEYLAERLREIGIY